MEGLSLQNVLACPLMQLGDGDGEREGAEGGDEEDVEETSSPNLSIKGHTYMKYCYVNVRD
jgi:hypothetical protein